MVFLCNGMVKTLPHTSTNLMRLLCKFKTVASGFLIVILRTFYEIINNVLLLQFKGDFVFEVKNKVDV